MKNIEVKRKTYRLLKSSLSLPQTKLDEVISKDVLEIKSTKYFQIWFGQGSIQNSEFQQCRKTSDRARRRVCSTHPLPPPARSAVGTRSSTAWSRTAAEPPGFPSPPRPAASSAFGSWRCGCSSGRIPAAMARRSLWTHGGKTGLKERFNFSLWLMFKVASLLLAFFHF